MLISCWRCSATILVGLHSGWWGEWCLKYDCIGEDKRSPPWCLFLSMLANVGRGRTFYLYYGHISEATRQERPVAAYLAMSSESSHLEA
jgi:hypothetical protein